jgi:hypothetical protein
MLGHAEKFSMSFNAIFSARPHPKFSSVNPELYPLNQMAKANHIAEPLGSAPRYRKSLDSISYGIGIMVLHARGKNREAV